MQSATLWVDGQDATSRRDTSRTRSSSIARPRPAAISDAQLAFPLSMSAREGRSVALLMDVWRPIVTAEGTDDELSERRKLNQLLTSVSSLATGSERDRLGLELAPGGLTF